MKRLASFLVSSVILLAASPVFAQPGPSPDFRGPMQGYGRMWGGGWGGDGWGGHGMIFGPFLMLLAIIGIVALILWLVRAFSHGGFHRWHGQGVCPHCGHGGSRGGALDILGERFARGEINKDEFEEKRRLLGR